MAPSLDEPSSDADDCSSAPASRIQIFVQRTITQDRSYATHAGHQIDVVLLIRILHQLNDEAPDVIDFLSVVRPWCDPQVGIFVVASGRPEVEMQGRAWEFAGSALSNRGIMNNVGTTSAIVKFPSGTAREHFLERAKTAYPTLVAKTHKAKRRPEAVIEELSETDIVRLRELVADVGGEVFEDVQFEPMEPH